MNLFKQRLKNGEKLYGLWLGSANSYITQIAAQAKYDWYLIDGEHAPNTITSIANQISILDAYGMNGIVRILDKHPAFMAQALDVGTKTVIVPMINNLEEAKEMINACKYPPLGTRGSGGYIIRAAKWGENLEYLKHANEETCLILQCETKEGLDNLDEILKLKEIDGIFVGPTDLSASLGFDGVLNENFQKIWFDTIRKVKSKNKFVGTLALKENLAKKAFESGANFVGIAVDVSCYLVALKTTLTNFKQ